MADPRELIPRAQRPSGQPQHSILFGSVADPAPFDSADDLFVIIPDISVEHKWGPCRWSSRPGAGGEVLVPGFGDECMMVFDNRRVPWVVVWWPYA